jgi:hypothetical protein
LEIQQNKNPWDTVEILVIKSQYSTSILGWYIVISMLWKDHKSFEVIKGIIYRKNNAKNKVICIPESDVRGRKLTELVIDQAHRIVGHLGARITESYARRFFWWTTIGQDIKAFCDSCPTCQATKTRNQRPQGLLHALPIPSMPWSSIGMDFVGPFPMANNLDYIWVVLCQLTSLVHLIPLRTTTTAAELAPIFMAEIVRLHGLPDTIHSMEITVYQPRILVEYCDFMTSISTVSKGFLFCCIFKISQPVS